MINNPAETVITACVIPSNRRMAFLPRIFGAWYAIAENNIYRQASRLCENYTGGRWEYKELSNGGGYLVPESADSFNLTVSGNYFEGELSADATGIVVTLFTLNALIWHAYENDYPHMQDMLITQQERLRYYAGQHEESSKIFAAID